MVKVDDFLKTGKNHRLCEDYILTGTTPFPYAILSDGCSSSKNTEMGSRLLCYEARQLITHRTEDELRLAKHEDTGAWIIHNAEAISRLLALEKTSLDATLIISYKIGTTIYVTVYGDGIVISQGIDDTITIYDINYSLNAPYYLSYSIDPKRDEEYYKMKNTQTVTQMVIAPNGVFTIVGGQRAYDYRESFYFNSSSFKSIIISSDGLKSFIKTTLAEPQLLRSIVKEILSFKTTTGEFLKRRLGRMIQDYEKDNIFHYDDISVGCFICEDDQ